MTSRTGTRRIVISTVILAVASAVFGVILLATRPKASAMVGMEMPGAGHQDGAAAGTPVHRPLVPVLGTFGGGTLAATLTAGLMRRKDRATNLAMKATRAAARSQK